jgi:hypothetical protein
MPVTVGSPTEVYVFVEFSHQVDGGEVGRIPFEVSGAAFTAIFGSPAPNTTTSLATILQEAIYNAAIAAGIMSGTVTPG